MILVKPSPGYGKKIHVYTNFRALVLVVICLNCLNPYHIRGRMNRNAVGTKILCPFLDIPTAF